ncbi:RluA family pseudouridine synthase [Rheinheimera sp.]|uniref:RluA family pseudouridine synthase n=1 Tax=Rheinheimera sp. TaxID=1869214 RepID=UPI00307F515D
MKISKNFVVAAPGVAIELLATAVPALSKARLKDAMSKGAVLWRRAKQHKRLRRAQAELLAGDRLELNYDDELLARHCDDAVLLQDEQHYSLWFKPAGMLSQGNEWGDHLSLLRFAEQHWQNKRPVFLLHRLDREASGLVLLAHSKAAAAALGQLLQQHQINKTYRIKVKGLPAGQGKIELPLDGKDCQTRYQRISTDEQAQCSVVEVDLITGRKHQIRRHFAAIGHPVLGDPAYGSGNKNQQGLMLQAIRLSFRCPLLKKLQVFELPASLRQC